VGDGTGRTLPPHTSQRPDPARDWLQLDCICRLCKCVAWCVCALTNSPRSPARPRRVESSGERDLATLNNFWGAVGIAPQGVRPVDMFAVNSLEMPPLASVAAALDASGPATSCGRAGGAALRRRLTNPRGMRLGRLRQQHRLAVWVRQSKPPYVWSTVFRDHLVAGLCPARVCPAPHPPPRTIPSRLCLPFTRHASLNYPPSFSLLLCRALPSSPAPAAG